MSSYPLNLPNSLKRAAERLAEQDGVSLDQWIATAVAEKVGAVEAADFFQRRAQGSSGSGLNTLLDKVAANPPMPGDELDR
ncbi:pilus assembly protein HicB [Indioceanicola profundi]|uniref:pilus assembly protein HicB n=1 Tax=Indioceanicola profundi TaxID=2220096 RepID=UPI000E6AB10E|nr:pilus assembly protein HicB [Indioceanicola profundi]